MEAIALVNLCDLNNEGNSNYKPNRIAWSLPGSSGVLQKNLKGLKLITH